MYNLNISRMPLIKISLLNEISLRENMIYIRILIFNG